MLQAYSYGGITFLKFGKKSSPGVMYRLQDIEDGRRPAVELHRDGTITYYDRPEGEISQMRKIRLPAWAYDFPIKRFKRRS